MTANEVADWFGSASPGSVLVYHVGRKLTDGKERITSGTQHVKRLWNAGMVDLCQKRLSRGRSENATGRFEFRAIKRKIPDKIKPEHRMDLKAFHIIPEA